MNGVCMNGLFITIAVIAVITVIGIAVAVMYNSLVKLRNGVEEGKGQIATQLQRRFDLIPNLVDTVKGYAKHEAELFAEVTKLRASVDSLDENSPAGDMASADASMSSLIGRVNVVAENYPDLKASDNFLKLQEELGTTENKVAFARQNYNDRVYDYNNKVESFPSNIIAGLFKFIKADMFDIEDEEARRAPKVQF